MKLEEFIRNNREEFDDDFPNELSWKALEERLPEEQKSRQLSVRMLMRVAAVLIFGFVAIEIWQQNGRATEEFSLGDVSEELGELEAHYIGLEDMKREEAFKVETLKPHEKEEIMEVLEELKEEFDMLKKDLADHSKDEVVIAAMIENYQLRVKILERILEDVSSSTKEETKTIENVSI